MMVVPTHTEGRRTQTFREPDVRTRMRLPYSRLSTIEALVHLRSPGVIVPVQASARPQPVPRLPCRAAPSRRSRTQGQEEPAALFHTENTQARDQPLAGSGVMARPASAAARTPVK